MIWSPIPNYEARYEASTLGEIRAIFPWRKLANPRIIKPFRGKYFQLWLSPQREAGTYRRDFWQVHVLIALTFLGSRPEGLEIRHLDGNNFNNRLDNLAYGTHSENQLDTVRLGKNPNANKSHCKYGHEFTEENTYRDPKYGYRYCVQCRRRSEHEAARRRYTNTKWR